LGKNEKEGSEFCQGMWYLPRTKILGSISRGLLQVYQSWFGMKVLMID